MTTSDARLREALRDPSSSARLQAALAAGTRPDPAYVGALIERCAVEPDFYVRDMLTWALTRHPADLTVPRLVYEAGADGAQARSQALHSLSKIRDPRGWAAISDDLLRDPDEGIARTAWRAAVVLVPDDRRADLAAALATQLGRGGRDVQLSLSRSLAELGDEATAALEAARASGDADARAHAMATERLILDPDEGFDTAIFEAKRIVAIGGGLDHSDRDRPPS